MVAGLVVRVGPGVRRVPGAGLDGERRGRPASIASSKRPCSWRMNASSPVNHQSSPYAGAQRSTIAQASCGTVGDAGEGDGRHRDREQQRVAWGARARWRDQRTGVAGDVPGDRVDVAALALGAAARRAAAASRSRASMSTGAHSSWPSSASAAWPSANVGSRATEAATACSAPSSQPEQVADAAVVRRDRVGAAGERQSVAVHDIACK